MDCSTMAHKRQNGTMNGFKWPATSNSTNSTASFHRKTAIDPSVVLGAVATAEKENGDKSKVGTIGLMTLSSLLICMAVAILIYRLFIRKRWNAKKEKDIEVASYDQPNEPARPVSIESAKTRVFGENASMPLPRRMPLETVPDSDSAPPNVARNPDGFEEVDLGDLAGKKP